MRYVRMQFTKRQQTQPDNAYTKKEEIMHKITIGLLGVAVVLALIPIY